ncbi:MAG: PAS domain S-box protein [Alphaproteobacteria bacterium]
MQGFFDVFPALSYWITASVWAIIVVVLLAKLRAAPRQHTAVTTLVLVLTLDAFRTLIESLYFGIYWSAVFGVLPPEWRDQLQNPLYVGVLKLVTVGTGLVVLVILLRRWLPADAHTRELVAESLQKSRMQTVQAEAKYRRIVETSLDVICTIDAEGRFVDLSPRCRDMWGYAPEEMAGRKFLDFVHPEDREGSEAEAAAIRAGTATDSFENRYVHKDGHVVHMMWSAVWSPADQLFYSVARDVSRRRELEIKRRDLEERLQQSQRLDSVGQLTGGVAHDFNNLLTVILGNAKLLEEKLASDADLRRIVETTHIAAQRGAELTQRLLAFSRRQALDPKAIDVNKLVGGVELLLRRLLGEHIDIRLDLDPEMWGIFVDPLQLESAVINLGVNARDAMPAGGRLTIRTYRCGVGAGQTQITCDGEMGPGEYAAIAVIDDGGGMSAETRDKAFEPFFTTKGLGKGSGLGLSMVYGFVKQSGGHVLLESAPGLGTTVTLFFPRDERVGAESAPMPAVANAAPSGHETVLIAEDNDLVRTYTAELLRKLGYVALEAASGAEALALLERHPGVDVLFSDLMMPGGMTGVELARRARAMRPGLKTLLTSGYVESAASSGATAEGIRILRKPYQGQELAKALRETLGS